MSQSAGGVHDVSHGALTGRLLAPVMEYNYAGEPERFARISQALGLDIRKKTVWNAAEASVEYVYQLTEDLDIPSLNELGFSEEEIPLLAQKAEADSQTIGNPRDVDARNYERIYARAFEAGRHRKVAKQLAHAGS
jgi:choline dehydrogenase